MNAKITNRTATHYTIEIDIPYHSSSMLKAEEVIQAHVNQVGILATGEALATFDTDGAPLRRGGRKWTSKGQIERTYQTPYGDVRLARHVYQSSQGGCGYCPLEERARIIRTATPKFAKMLTAKYADGSGLRVRDDLRENHSREVSKRHIQQICETVGSIASAKEESWTYRLPVFPEPITTISIGVDGTGMLMCEDGARQAMVGTLALYTATGTRLHTTYIAAQPEYGKATFFRHMEREIARMKQRYPTAEYIGLADGAHDNWTFLERHTDVQRLDFYHVTQYLGQVAQAVMPKKTRDRWREETCHYLKHTLGAAEEIFHELQGYAERDLPEQRQAMVTAAVTYFQNHKHRMAYGEAVAQHKPIGSGVTEAACKVIVKQRLCGSGMQWKEDGAAVVLTLRCLNYSRGRWEQFWQKLDRYGFSLATSFESSLR